MLLTVVMREGKRKFQFSEKNFITLFLAREGVAMTPKPFPTAKTKKSTCSLTPPCLFLGATHRRLGVFGEAIRASVKERRQLANRFPEEKQ